MAEETAFFRFDTNAGAIASDIAGAMGRIRESLSSQAGYSIDKGQFDADQKAFTQGFTRMEEEIRQSQARIKRLMSGVQSGDLSLGDFAKGYRQEVSSTMRGLPAAMAQELARTGQTSALRLPAAEMGQQFGRDYLQSVTDYIEKHRPELGRGQSRLNLSPTQFSKELARIDATPVAYGREEQGAGSRIEYLTNKVRAEAYLNPTNLENIPSHMLDYVNQLKREAVQQNRYDDGSKSAEGKVQFIPSTARDELTELTRAARIEADELKRLGKVYDQNSEKARRLAAAEEALTFAMHGTKRFGGRIPTPTGGFLKPSGQEETAPIPLETSRQAMADYEERVRNMEMLGQRYNETRNVGASTVALGRGENAEFYRINNDNEATRIRGTFTLQQMHERLDKILSDELLKTQRLAEFDGKRAVRSEANQSGFLGGFMNRFHRGEQTIATGLGGQVASAAAFSLAYGSLFALQGALRDTLKEFQDYQDSMTDLEVATKDSSVVTDDFVHHLGELARVSGANVGASLDTAARGIRAFGAAGDGSVQSIQAIGEATNEAATKLSLIADKGLPDATGDLIASGSAFGLGPDQLNQVVDAVANAKRNVGGDAGQISQGLALIAGGAQEAGFTLNEAASVIGLVQARTDQSGQAIATRLTRIFQIIAGSTGKGLARELNVDPTQSVKQQIEAYASIYSNPNTSEPVKDRITSALGGTANLRELLPLLKENSTLQTAYANALNNSGQGTAEFQRKSENLVGILKKIQGTISAIQVEFAKSGVFAPLGAAVRVLEPALHALDRMLQIWNEMPDSVRNALGVMIDFLAVSKAIAIIQARSIAAQGADMAATLGVSAADALKARAMGQASAKALAEKGVITSAQTAATETFFTEQAVISARNRAAAAGSSELILTGAGAAESTAARGGLRGALSKSAAKGGMIGGAASLGEGLVNPATIAVAAAIGGLLLFNKYQQGKDDRNRFLSTQVDSQTGALGRIDGVGTSRDMHAAAQDLRSAAGNVKKTNAENMGYGDLTRKEVAKNLKEEAQAIDAIAKGVAKQEKARAASADIGVFGTGAIETVSQLASGMKELADAGQTGVTRLRLFKQALERDVAPEDPRMTTLNVAGIMATKINAALADAIPSGGLAMHVQEKRFTAGAYSTFSAGTEDVVKNLSRDEAYDRLKVKPEDIRKLNTAILTEAAKRGFKPGDPMSDDQINSIVNEGASSVDLSDVVRGAGMVRSRLIAQLRASLGTESGDSFKDFYNQMLPPELQPMNAKRAKAMLNGRGKLNRNQVKQLLYASEDGSYGGLAQIIADGEKDIPKNDDGRGLERVRRQGVQLLRELKRRSPGVNIGDFNLLLSNAEHDYAEVKIANLQKLSEAERGERGLSKGAIRAIGMKFLRKRINVAGDNTDLLIEIMKGADEKSLDIIEASLKRASELEQAEARSVIHRIDGGTVIGRGASKGKAGPDERRYNRFRRARRQSNIAPKDGTDLSNPDGDPPKDTTDKETAGDRAAAAAAAQAARVGGQIAPARAALIAARNKLNEAKPHTVAFFEALQSLYEAQRGMRDAVAAYRNNLDQLHGDMTDPVEQARDSLRAARRALRNSRSKDERAENRVAVRNAQNQLESDKFSQRLSDVQTAEQLGKISHAAYIKYLSNEHDRLTRIKHRTRQQTDELNQIDLAMKEAKNQMDGQFNLGDINTNGLVYQVRRAAAENRAMTAQGRITAGQRNVSQNVNIAINGADVAKVKSILQDYLRVPTAQRRTLANRRV